TRTATVILGQGARRVIGVGRVKTPTLAIVCQRELEIRDFVPLAYFEVVATAKAAGGQFQMRHAPQDRIVRREIAQEVVNAAEGFEGALAVRVEDKRQGPPKLHDLPSLQKLCGSRFGWPVRADTKVALEFQGLTGLAGISLTGGAADAAPVLADGGGLPTLYADPNASADVTQAARNVLARVDGLVAEN